MSDFQIIKQHMGCFLAFRFQRHELFALCDEMMEDLQLMSRGGSLPPILQV